MMTLEKYFSKKGINEKKWINSYREEWESDDQFLCHVFLSEFYQGFHHIPSKIKKQNNAISITFQPHYFSNVDYDHLTRLVIMSHNWGIRIGITWGRSGFINLCLANRKLRAGGVGERIPTIQEMVEKYGDI